MVPALCRALEARGIAGEAGALDSGYTTLILTTDVGVNGKRGRDLRNGFATPMKYSIRTLMDGALHPRWSFDVLRHGIPQLANFVSDDVQDIELQTALTSRQMDASFSFDDLAWLRNLWPHKLLVKGLSRSVGATRCIELGADGVILSNHGRRQLDSAVSPLETLRETANRVAAPVLLDSGIRHGFDVVKSLALGARAVLLGRATLYGKGAEGVDAERRNFRGSSSRPLTPSLSFCDWLSLIPPGIVTETFRQRPCGGVK
jgi:(S)-mandelate dehydrogenase